MKKRYCSSVMVQFILLTWKNLILMKRELFSTVSLLLVTLCCPLALLIFNYYFGITISSEPSTEPPFQLTEDFNFSKHRDLKHFIAFTPINIKTKNIVERAVSSINNYILDTLEYGSESELESALLNSSEIFAGIVFLKSSFNEKDLSQNITYKVRLKEDRKKWFTKELMPNYHTQIGPLRQRFGERGGSEPGYYNRGFLAIQRAVDSSIIVELGGVNSTMKTFLKKMAYPGYVTNMFYPILRNLFSVVTMIGFINISSSICKEVVDEKEKKLKEYMKLLGLRNWINWSAWFFKYAFLGIVLSGCITAVYHAKAGDVAILSRTSPLITFVLILLYSLSTINFSFAITTLFDKAKTAVFAAVVGYFISTCVELYIKFSHGSMNAFQKLLICLFPNLSLCLGCRIILNFEEVGIGIQWNTLNRMDDENKFSLLDVFGMLLADIVLYGLVTWYIDAVRPGEFGSPQPFYFLFQKQYWCGLQSNPDFNNIFDESVSYGNRSEFFESSPNCEIGIKIRRLTKVFEKGSKPVVNDLNLDICEGDIVALLGHNGAGKTTTMSMLSGFITPTQGSALINGLNIRGNMEEIRQNLGFCPQSNILFDNMTVKEHLYFFAKLKTTRKNNIRTDVSDTISALNLIDKKNSLSKSLSGGMKRKLSIAIALIGGSKFMILDEPSSGLDTEARREIWDILKFHQQGRTMILSTHYMDEADYLADKIAIMADGVLQCYGSSMFLKKKYGIGYQLTIVKTDECNPTKIYELVTSKVPDAQLKNSTGAELTYHLPKERSSTFSSLFSELEVNGKEFGVDNFGVSITSLEEVFIKVGELCQQSEKCEDGEMVSINITPKTNKPFQFEPGVNIGLENSRTKGISLTMTKICAMLHKRFLCSLRSKMDNLSQIITPAVFTIIACIVLNSEIRNIETTIPPPLTMDLENYDSPITVYATVDGANSTSDDSFGCYRKALQKMTGSYIYLNNHSYNYNSSRDMDEYFIELASQNLHRYRRRYQIATEIGPDYFIGFYNDESYHTMATTLSLIDNAWLQCLLKSPDPSLSYSIRTINHPVLLPMELSSEENQVKASSVGFAFYFGIFIALSSLTANFSVFLINERMTGAKVSQYISGASSYTFWLSTFIWDYFSYLISSISIVIVIIAMQTEVYSSGTIPGYIFLGLMTYGWSSLPSVYMLSFLFSKGSTGFKWISTLQLLSGITIMIFFLLQTILSKTASIFDTLEWVLYTLMPSFCLIKMFQNILLNHFLIKFCSSTSKDISFEYMSSETANTQHECCKRKCSNYIYWEHPGVGKSLTFMAVQGIIYFVILFFIESDFIKYIKRQIVFNIFRIGRTTNSPEEDDDVSEERRTVLGLQQEELISDRNILVLKQLSKRYGLDDLAVNILCLKVSVNECFGLLGVNGAGKTSVFKMLTGEEIITGGEIYMNGINVAKNLTKTRKNVGYCPQTDSLIDQLTVQEHLELHARLRGIPCRRIKSYINEIAQHVMIAKYANKTAKQLSGGNKRKLCLGIALVGNSKLLFLDEPTTGIDPVARRELWDLLTFVRQTGSTIMLTSHSMEECEALCTRLAIMVNGQFMCLGSTQHLKSKFGSGYSVVLKTLQSLDQEENISVVSNVKEFILNHFPGSMLKLEGGAMLNYLIEKSIPGATLANIFELLENSKEALKLDDYSVGQATLEQIFINFALNQHEFKHKTEKKFVIFDIASDEYRDIV